MNADERRSSAQDIFAAGLRAVDPYGAVMRHRDVIRETCRNGKYASVIVAGFGKAACPMAKAAEDALGDIPRSGAAITKYGHCAPAFTPRSIRIFEGGHPVPDARGHEGTREVIRLVREADETALVLCLVSGGGSALLVSPFGNVSLEEKQKTTQLLLRAGADIYELNTVRKHLSSVKGGRLAELAHPAGVLSLILSDVMGDNLDVIASGPTAPDTSTYPEAWKVMEKYSLVDALPVSVRDVLEGGVKGVIPETPKQGSSMFSQVKNVIIGSNIIAIEAARTRAVELGFQAEVLSSEIKGEARDVGRWLAGVARERQQAGDRSAPLCLISGGETTVTVKGGGIGGRNMEFALGFAETIRGVDGITLLSAGTDGTDGPTDAAGAIVDGGTIDIAESRGLDLAAYLNDSDSYHYLKQIDGLLMTGPTGTNVMDLQIVIIE